MGSSPEERQIKEHQPEFVHGKKNKYHVPTPSAGLQPETGGTIVDNRKDDYLDRLRSEFLTEEFYSPEQAAIEELRDREPEEVPDFPEMFQNEEVMGEYARHAVSSAYVFHDREYPETNEENDPPEGSDGGRVLTVQGRISGYGWIDEDGNITSSVLLDGTITNGSDH